MEFISSSTQLLNAYSKDFDSSLIALSIIIAITSSFTAFGVAERINKADKQIIQSIWVVFGAISMGLGIWAMHFIGSLALRLPIPVSYNLHMILLSMLPAILVSSTVLWLMIQSFSNQLRLLLCGIFLGLGICNMHIIGMMSWQFDAQVYYVPNLLVVAIIIAILFATVALSIQFEAFEKSCDQIVGFKQIKSAIVMGFAVSGMYYTVMHATVFLPGHETGIYAETIDSSILAYMISGVILLILLLAIVTPLALRYRQMSFDLFQQEQNLRIAATAFQAHDAIMITDEHTRIIKINDAFTEMTGYQENEVLGNTPKILQSGKHDARFYAGLWQQLLSEESWCGEIWNRRKNSEIFPCWQTISTVKNREEKITHYVSSFSDISKFKANEKEIERLAFYDPLTELPNRRLLKDHLEHEFNTANRYQRHGVLLFMDLDRFKHINDSLGHSVGDEILIMTAKRLLSILRKSDIAVRLGGDEYIILIPTQSKSITDIITQAQSVAERVIHSINQPYQIGSHNLFISTSIGITLFSGNEESSETILKQADTAMYQAKEAGRNTFRFYHKSMQEEADSRLILEKYLRTACINNEFTLHYQLQFSKAKEIVGAEALIRWNHPELGLTVPAHFIPVAEETGIIVEIGEWVLQEVCAQMKALDELGVVIPHMAVNISLRQFHQKNFTTMLKATIEKANIPANRILLEITESVFLKNFEETAAIMNELKTYGFRFSIDDFGTGYASLSFLKRLPFDQLKIDQSFVHDLMNDPDNTASAIVQAIIAMANSMGLNLIAEGVETDQQLQVLSNFGCHYFQGYYFVKPLAADEFNHYCQQYLLEH